MATAETAEREREKEREREGERERERERGRGRERDLLLGLFKVILYFPTEKSTMWEIYTAIVIFLSPLIRKSM